MSTLTTLTITHDASGIGLIAIDLPDRPMNVLTPQLQADLSSAIDLLAADPAIKGIVLTSGKAGAFVAGADIKDMVQAFDRGLTAREAAAMSQSLHSLLRRIETCGKPVACAINGFALGGGLELALACHFRVLADDASVGLPEVGLGLLPGGGGTQRLPRLIGIEKAGPLLLTGAPVKAAEALKLGIVHAISPSSELVDKARAWLQASPDAVQPWDKKGFRVPGGVGPLAPHAMRTFAAGTAVTAKNTQRNYPAALAILSCVYEGTQLPIDVGLRIESKYFGQLLAGPVARNMMRTLFINKNAADKLMRRPAGIPKQRVVKLGVLGAGMMGAGIAYVAASKGIDVVLLDTTRELAAKGRQYSEALLQKAIARGKLTQAQADTQLARIHPSVDYADLDGCDLVIEAVFEQRQLKNEVLARAGAVLAESAILASNTSSLPITGLAQNDPRPERFIGLHFFSPVDKMPLVEVIRGERTSDATLAKALDFVAQLKKTPIVVNDGPSFYTTRVFATFFMEGLLMLEEGIAPALIENGARMAGMPVGPLQVSDEVSMQFQLMGMEQQLADGHAATPHGERAMKVLRKMVLDHKRIGRRGGAGFYDYTEDGKRTLWPGLAQAFPLVEAQPDVEQIKQRLLTIQALETARCVEAGVLDCAADADVGSILGIGFPAWTGGTLSYIDTLGLPVFVGECERLALLHGERFAPSAWLKAKAKREERFHPPMVDAA